MANLAITNICNRTCAYCFTVDHIGGQVGPDDSDPEDGRRASTHYLSLGRFRERLSFLARSGMDEVRLLGGEPTLHPRFAELVAVSREAGKRLVVFSNGLMPPVALDALLALPAEDVSVLVNVTPTGNGNGDGVLDRQRETIKRLGERAIPGVNLSRADVDLGFLRPLIAESRCRPVVRVGMAQPCLSGENEHIVPNQYRAIALLLLRFARASADAGVSLDLDCGFVRCMFSDAEMVELRAIGSKIEWQCSPILDVDLAGNVLHCYPLSGFARLPLAPAKTTADLRADFERLVRPFRQAGVYKECSSCGFKASGECTGGCLATTMRRFRHTPFAVQAPRDGLAQ